jgi:hypothetical protein
MPRKWIWFERIRPDWLGDNLVSVDGVEEDGVDNRVEAPTWVPDGGSDSKSPGQKADEESATTPDSAAGQASTETDTAAAPAEEPVEEYVSRATAATGWSDEKSADRADRTPAANGTPSAPSAAAPGNGSTQPASIFAPPPLPADGTPATAFASAAGAARGLAARVSAPFSTIGKTRSKPRPKTPPPSVKRPSGAVAPPRPQGAKPQGAKPQGVRPQARLTPGPMTGQQTRRAQLKLDRIEPWSVMKFSFLISLIAWVVLMIAVSLLYFTLSKLGVFTSIEHTVGLVTTSKSKPGSNAASWFKASRVLGYTMLVGAVNVILFTALATIGAVLYNLVTMLAGGIEVTLKESD